MARIVRYLWLAPLALALAAAPVRAEDDEAGDARSEPSGEGGGGGWSRVKQGFKDAGHAIGSAGRSFGHAVRDGAKEVGHAVAPTARAIGQGTKDAAKTVGEGTKETGRKVGEGAKEAGHAVKKAVKGDRGDKADAPESD